MHLFEYGDLVIAVSAIFCFLFAFITSKINKEPVNPIPFKEIIRLGILYTINIAALNFSLFYIPYPVRVVGDKLGYLTAVAVGVWFTRVPQKTGLRLGGEKFIIAMMITAGTMIFAFSYKVIVK